MMISEVGRANLVRLREEWENTRQFMDILGRISDSTLKNFQ